MADNQILAGIIFSAVGLGILFFGYRFFKVALGIMGFSAGFIVCVVLASDLTEFNRTELLVSGVVSGIVGTFLFVMAYYAGVFVMGAFLGYMLGTAVAPYIHLDPLVIVAIAVVLGAMITFAVQKVVIVCLSSFFGAWLFLIGMDQLFSRLSTATLIREPEKALFLYQEMNWMMAAWLVVSLIGIYSQYRGIEKKKGKRNPGSSRYS